MRRLYWVLTLLTLSIIALPGFGPLGATERIAAIVNKDVILESDVDEQLKLAIANLRIDPNDSTTVAKLRKDVLKQLVDEQVIMAEAARQNITIPKASIDKAVTQAVQDVKTRMGSEENYRKALAQEKMTEADLRKKYEPDIRKQLTVMQLVEREVQSKTTVTDAEVKLYYVAHRDSIGKKPEQLKLAAIVFGFEPDSAQVKRLRSRADSLRAVIVKGKPFDEVARAASDDPSGQSGGDLGTFGRGDMVREFEDVAFDLKPMEISQLVRSRFGFHIIQVLEHMDATDSTAERVHARHILVQSRLGPGDEERARKRATAVRDSIMRGADFTLMAKRHSMDSASRDSGGYMGEIPVTALPPNFQEPVTGLRDSEVSVPLKGEAGYYIVKLLGRIPESEYVFSDIKEELRRMVLNQKLKDGYDRWLERIRKTVNIEIKD